jgi:hypothetical protein
MIMSIGTVRRTDPAVKLVGAVRRLLPGTVRGIFDFLLATQ